MKTFVEVAFGIAFLALIPLVLLDRNRSEDEAITVKKGGTNFGFFGLGKDERMRQLTKSERPLISAVDSRINHFLASCRPVYDFEDPADVYLLAWQKVREAQEVRWLGSKNRLDLLAEASSAIEGVALFAPRWKPHLVERKRLEIRGEVEKSFLVLQDEEPKEDFEMPVFQSRRLAE